jgi:hypothetical protein
MATVTERAFAATPATDFRRGLVASPFQFWTTGEENLRIESANSRAGVRVAVHFRFLNPDGTITAHAVVHIPTSDRSIAQSEHALGGGAILNLTAFALDQTPQVGETFVRVQLIRGTGAAAIVVGTLCQGYITSHQDLGYPGSPIALSTEATGIVRAVQGSVPAVGTEILEVVPPGARWEVLGVNAALTTSAAAGNRLPRLYFRKTIGLIMESIVMVPLGPGATQRYWWNAGMDMGISVARPHTYAPIPASPWLSAGDHIETITDNFSVIGDQWGAPTLVVREVLEVL